MAAELLLRVLGPLRLERDGREVDLGGSRQREVLARLAVADGQPVSAEALLSDVWGPGQADSSAAALHVSVSKVRRAIDPDRRARSSSPLVSAVGGYALTIRTDAADVEERARRASGLAAAGDLTGAHAELSAARAAWRGEPYEGIGEHSWLVLERRRCDELRLYVATQFAETSLRKGDAAAGVIVDLTALAQRHPTHEHLATLLAVALYREQRQDDALRVLRSTRDHLRDHSGLDPGPEFQRIEQVILAQEPDPYVAADVPATQSHSAAQVSPTAAAAVTPWPGRSYPLTGRGRPRAVLAAAAEAAEAGHATTALLVGEAGIGKTRLARTVTDELTARGWQAVWTHGSEAEGAPALWPWLSVVRQLGRHNPLGPELSALDDRSDVPVSGSEAAAARWRQTQQIAELLTAATDQAPLLVVLDDLHWTDAASQALLADITSRSAPCRLLLLVTSRPTGSAGLTTTFARLARLGVIRLELDGLSEADIQALAAAAGLEVNARALRDRTGGNPFLLQETLAFAVETGASPLDVVPASVADVLGARMERLPAAAEAVLQVASVLGSVSDPSLLATLADLSPDQVDDGLELALNADLLRAGPDGTIGFRHDLVRETAYRRVGTVRRSRLHARALDLLEAAGHRNPALLAAHARGAGPAHAERMVHWSIAAAVEAASRRAPDSALQWWRAAYDADSHAVMPDTSRRVRVMLGLLRAQLDAGDAVGAIESRSEAVQAAVDVDDPALIVQALTSLDRPMVWLPRPMGRVNPEMVQHLERALAARPAPADPDRCLLLATLAIELYGPGEEARCDDLTRQALAIAEGLDDASRLAFALNARIAATAFPLRELERAAVADRLVELGRSSDLPSVELAGHQFACRLRLQLFEVRAADEHAQEARRLAEELRLPLSSMQQQLWDSSRRALDGDFAGALRLLDDVAKVDWPWWGREAMLATVRLTLALRARSATDAAPLLDLAATVNPRMATDARAWVSAHAGAAPRLPLASEPPPRDWTWLSSACIHAQAALALDDQEAIQSTYELLLAGTGCIASTGSFDAGPVDAYLADLAAGLGRSDEEHRHRQQLAALAGREGLRL